ncbi:uncharacterized protein LOC113358050 [Papaver somniferum]|uniref:uncharacterized protein LOC113358050 n=1 Tax=Papaver somniferum TaxID=3469 RepID=UPI000E702100|nr:uncharacterized protein LOC113358050 [Papaver somniferum]XP_026457341.1 uncharacterized protein LOC113358050 [Papaver somniferum]XP_026457342.1 uncharacterized protein LOC113358050 [Papaver somniferum]
MNLMDDKRDRPEGNFVRKWSKSVEWEVTNEHGSAPIIVIITATFVKEVQGAQKERGYGHTDAMTYALLEVYYTSLSLTYMECFNGRLNLRYLQKNLLQFFASTERLKVVRQMIMTGALEHRKVA